MSILISVTHRIRLVSFKLQLVYIYPYIYHTHDDVAIDLLQVIHTLVLGKRWYTCSTCKGILKVSLSPSVSP